LVTDTAPPFPEIAEAFAGVCDRAAEHGLVVHLEFLPWTPIRDLKAALEIVEMADRPNGGVMLDSWHHFRSGADDELLRRLPGTRILGVQLNDAPREPEPDLIAETTRRRLLPGEGDIDLVGLVRILDEIGSRAPIGVEVFSEKLFALPAREVARRAGDAVREILRRARSSPR
jgi:sugar phosphate isomerase/epimerase